MIYLEQDDEEGDDDEDPELAAAFASSLADLSQHSHTHPLPAAVPPATLPDPVLPAACTPSPMPRPAPALLPGRPSREVSARSSLDGRMFQRLQSQASGLLAQASLETNAGVGGPVLLTLAEKEFLADRTLAISAEVIANHTSEPCCICLSEMTFGEVVSMLQCQHRMHTPCVRAWLLGKTVCVCPLCKQVSCFHRG